MAHMKCFPWLCSTEGHGTDLPSHSEVGPGTELLDLYRAQNAEATCRADTSQILDDERSDVENHCYCVAPVVLKPELVLELVLVVGLVRVRLHDVAGLLQQG